MENENKCSVDNLLLEHEIDLANGLIETKEKYRKVVQAGIAHWIKDFQQGRIEIKTVDDLKKLIEIDLQLQKDDY